MKTIIIALFLACTFACAGDRKPNIIFIMADDMGYADAGCYGQKIIQTPTIDMMAVEGMRFTDCYSGAPVCAPARSVLMTGLHTGHTRVRGNMGKIGVEGAVKGLTGKARVPLQASDFTVAEMLKKAGYVTGMTGKWGLGEPGTPGEPNDQGFDHWFGYLNQARAHTYYPTFLWKNKEKIMLPGNANGKKSEYTHDMCTDYAHNFVKEQKDKPFFLYLPYCIPHSKLEIPDVAPYQNSKLKESHKIYAAMITRMDRDIGRLIDLLKELKIDDNTIIFFCSDNGAAARYDGVFDSSGPLKGYKRSMYEGGIRVPMVVRWPKNIAAGQVSAEPWTFTDFFPTCVDLAGASKPANLDGVSVLPTLQGKNQNLSKRFLYWEFYERGFKQAARWKNWKAVRLMKGQKLITEIYDLSKDIGEKNNIADKMPELVQTFEKYFAKEHVPSKSWKAPID